MERGKDIYLMGIGGTGMGAMAGLLKQSGHRVFGSDNAVYSPMKEKLSDWGISYQTPYDAKNLPDSCDLVIVGNVIRRDNPEALELMNKGLAYESFPSALNKLFLKDATPLVASGTHGKTTCTSLLAHTLFHAGKNPGFLVGGIPLNFGESFRAPSQKNAPFVVEGDEYDTAFFDKQPKFMHYDPKFLLVTSIEFDHADIYRDLDAVIQAFNKLFLSMNDGVIVVESQDQNIKTALAGTKVKVLSYGKNGDYQAVDVVLDEKGAKFSVVYQGHHLGSLSIPLFGEHNLKNALGCYAMLHQYGLTHQEIAAGFESFLGVRRRLHERGRKNGLVVVDDFAHHPSAVLETIKAARQKYPRNKICAIFEARSATSCMPIFEKRYEEAFMGADLVLFAPLGRAKVSGQDQMDTKKIASGLNEAGVKAKAFDGYEPLSEYLNTIGQDYILLFMSNGDFKGMSLES
jgi:UDP-N-acetylmuramate: L-alanyl-gamma-D-glutamyl-meso-diaminopimelate ligase